MIDVALELTPADSSVPKVWVRWAAVAYLRAVNARTDGSRLVDEQARTCVVTSNGDRLHVKEDPQAIMDAVRDGIVAGSIDKVGVVVFPVAPN